MASPLKQVKLDRGKTSFSVLKSSFLEQDQEKTLFYLTAGKIEGKKTRKTLIKI